MKTDEMITAIRDDGTTYPVDKLDAHVRNVRHVAISVFILRGGRLLLQQRAAGKYHSPGLWANSCCSHPRWQENIEDSVVRRLGEELGFSVPVSKVGVVAYAAAVGDLYENEVAHCYAGTTGDPEAASGFNGDEVSSVRWCTLEQIDFELQTTPEIFAPWFRIYMTEHRTMIEPLFGLG